MHILIFKKKYFKSYASQMTKCIMADAILRLIICTQKTIP